MRQLADDLDHFARRHGLRRGVEAAAVLKAARAAVARTLPANLAGSVTARSFRSGVLTLQAPAGATLANAAAYRGAVLDALAAAIGPTVVTAVVVRAAPAADVPPQQPTPTANVD